jgi:FkbM family methyltransferase
MWLGKVARMLPRWLRPAAIPPAHVFGRKILNGAPLVAIDVGAAAGLQPHWQPLDGLAHVYAFEPHPDSCRQLREIFDRSAHPALYTVLPVALSGTGGTRTLYVTNVPTGTSILPLKPEALEWVNRSYTYPLQERQIQTRRLQDVLDEQKEANADLIKLDVQGAELEILRGLGPERLGKLTLAELEINLLEVYQGQAGPGEVIAFLDGHGLELVDVRVNRAYRPMEGDPEGYQTRVFNEKPVSPTLAARAWEFDAVFFRRQPAVLAAGEPTAVRKLLVAYCTYHYFTEAYHLIGRARQAGILSESDSQELGTTVIDWHGAERARFRRHSGLLPWLVDGDNRPSPLATQRWAQYVWVSYPHG